MKKGVKEKVVKIGKVVEKMRKIEDKVFEVKLDKPFKSTDRTFGQRAVDGLTKWAGSWFFIIFLGIFLLIWISINTAWLIFGGKWDPYPFILLNFILSTLAAVQAPIILMSQNRESQKDRARSKYDYAVNKKAEKEIRQIQAQLTRVENRLKRK